MGKVKLFRDSPYRDSPYGEFECGHCGGVNVTLGVDIRDSYEWWTPITCDYCGKESYEVRKGYQLVMILAAYWENQHE